MYSVIFSANARVLNLVEMISAESGWMVSEWKCSIDPDTNICTKSRRVQCSNYEPEVHLRRPGIQMPPIVDRRKSETVERSLMKCTGNKPPEYESCSACP